MSIRPLLVLALAALPAVAQTPSPLFVMTTQGRLLDASDNLLDGSKKLKFTIYENADAPTDGSTEDVLWEDELTVNVYQGLYSTTLGLTAGKPLTPIAIGGGTKARWIEIAVEDQKLKPRLRIASVPFAMRAASAATADLLAADCVGCVTHAQLASDIPGSKLANGSVTRDKLAQDGCMKGEILKWTGSQWDCVESYSAALNGGLELDQGAFSIASSGVKGEHIDDGVITRAKLAQDQCTLGQILKLDASGKWICGEDTGTIYSPGAGLVLDPSKNEFAANFTASGIDSGVATTVARGDHDHDALYPTRSDQSALVGRKRPYVGMFTLKSPTATAPCPSGWNDADVSALGGGTSNTNVYAVMTRGGPFLGAINGLNYGYDYLYQRIPQGNNAKRICWKAFETQGRPHVHVLGYTGTSTCPSGYVFVSDTEAENIGGNTHFNANDAGFFLGALDDWSRDAQNFSAGWHYRYASNLDGWCFKVMGVDDDPATAWGVFPVVLGVQDSSSCTEPGYTFRLFSETQAGNSSYLSISDNMTAMGGLASWSHGGENWNYLRVLSTSSVHYCWKFYPLTGKPWVDIRGLNTGNCPSGFISLNVEKVNGSNTNAYIQRTGHGLYIGGIYDSNGYGSQLDGHLYVNITTAATKICYRVHNVSSFP